MKPSCTRTRDQSEHRKTSRVSFSERDGVTEATRRDRAQPYKIPGPSPPKDVALTDWLFEIVNKRRKEEALRKKAESAPVPIRKVEELTRTASDSDLSTLLRQWMARAPVSILLLGEKGAGKSFLLNTLLESTLSSSVAPLSPKSKYFERKTSGDGLLLTPEDASPSAPSLMVDGHGSGTFGSMSVELMREFPMPDDFAATVNHASEGEARTNLADYLTSGSFNRTVGDRYSFLLPQGPFAGISARSYTLTHGETFELIVEFVRDTELRHTLWELHRPRTPGGARRLTEAYAKYLQRQYRHVLALPRDAAIPLPVSSPADLPLAPHVQQVLGLTYRFPGRGQDLDLDRIYVREKLLETVTQFGFLVESVHLRVPSDLLRGQIRISVADSDAIDPYAVFFRDAALARANLVLLAQSSGVLSSPTAGILRSSQFLSKLVRHPDEHKLIVVDLSERVELDDSGVRRNLQVKTKAQNMEARHHLCSQLKALLLESGDLDPRLVQQGADAIPDRVFDGVSFFYARPLLYASLLAGHGRTLSTFQDSLSKSNIPTLLAHIDNMLLSKCASSIKDFNEKWLESAAQQSGGHRPHTAAGGLFTTVGDRFSNVVDRKKKEPSGPSRTAQLISHFQEKVQEWKDELTEADRAMYAVVRLRTQESSELFDHFRRTDARESVRASLRVFFDYDMRSFWESRIVGRVFQLAESMAHYAQQLLNECSKVVKLPPEFTQRDRTRCLQILKFCLDSVDRTVRLRMKKTHHLMAHLDMPRLVRDAVLKCHSQLQTGVVATSAPKTDLLDDLPLDELFAHHADSGYRDKFRELMIRTMYASYAEVIDYALKQIDAIELHLEDSVRCVFYSPFLKATQMMHFLMYSQSQHEDPATAGAAVAGSNRDSLSVGSFREFEQFGPPSGPRGKKRGFFGSRRLQGKTYEPAQPVKFSAEQWSELCPDPGQISPQYESSYSTTVTIRGLDVLCINDYYRTDPSNMAQSFGPLHWQANFGNLAAQSIVRRLQSLPSAGRKGDQLRFRQQLISAELELSDVTADGNSQFRSLARLGYGGQEAHTVVRMLLMSELLSDPGHYAKLIGAAHDPDSVTEFVCRRSKEGEEGDHVTLHAFANVTNCDVLVYSPLCESPLLIEPRRRPLSQPGSLRIGGRAEEPKRRHVALAFMPHRHDPLLHYYQPLVNAAEDVEEELAQLQIAEPGGGRTAAAGSVPGPAAPIAGSFRPLLGGLPADIGDVQDAPQKRQQRDYPEPSRDALRSKVLRSASGRVQCGPATAAPSPPATPETPSSASEVDQSDMDVESTPTAPPSDAPAGAVPAAPLPMDDVPLLARTPKTLADTCVDILCQHADAIESLQGSLPEELLQRVIALVIARGRLTPTIFERLVDTSLTSLDLSNCRPFTPAMARTLALQCPSLRRLSLAQCLAVSSDHLASLASGCASLTELDLDGCSQVGDEGLIALVRRSHSMKTLRLSGCSKLTDVAVREVLANCPAVAQLHLNGCTRVTQDAFRQPTFAFSESSYFDLSRLELLELEDCAIVIAGYEEILTRCPRLAALKLSGPQVTDAVVAALARCTRLASLHLIGCAVEDPQALRAVARRCPLLSVLSVRQCRALQDEHFAALFPAAPASLIYSSSPHLAPSTFTFHVGHAGSPMGIAGPSAPEGPSLLQKLEELDLFGCRSLTSAAVERIAVNCHKLRAFRMGSCEGVAENALLLLCSRCPLLADVDLSNCGQVTDRLVVALASRCPGLRRLNLSNCRRVTDAGLAELGRCCPQLTEVVLSTCEAVTDVGLKALALGCRSMRTLRLEDTKVSDAGVGTLAVACTDIEELSLAYCKSVGDASLRMLAKYCAALRSLDISYANGISAAGLKEALPSWPKLRVLLMKGHSGIAGDGFAHPGLQLLNVSWCKNLRDSAVAAIAEGCPLLETVQMAWCEHVSTNAVHLLRLRAALLRCLNIRGCNNVSRILIRHLADAGLTIYK